MKIEELVSREYEKIKKVIVEECLKKLGNSIEAILFIGSFAYKEASFIIRNGKVKFLNDCDVMIIVNSSRIDKRIVKILRDNISKRINPEYIDFENAVEKNKIYNFYVDPRIVRIQDLKKFPNRIKYFDILNNPCIIHRKENFSTNVLPKIKLEKIPKEDALVHMFNRGGLLLQFNPRTISDPILLAMFIGKAYVAILDGILLTNGIYKSSVKDKLATFISNLNKSNELIQVRKGFVDRVKYFAELKLNLHRHSSSLNGVNITKFWKNAKDDLLTSIIYVINKIYNTNFSLSLETKNIMDIARFLMKNTRFIIYPYVAQVVKIPIPIKIVEKAINYKFYKRYYSKIETIKRALKLERDITTMLYILILLSLSSIDYIPNSDRLVAKNHTFKYAEELLKKMWIGNYENIEGFVKTFADLFRKWEAFIFEF